MCLYLSYLYMLQPHCPAADFCSLKNRCVYKSLYVINFKSRRQVENMGWTNMVRQAYNRVLGAGSVGREGISRTQSRRSLSAFWMLNGSSKFAPFSVSCNLASRAPDMCNCPPRMKTHRIRVSLRKCFWQKCLYVFTSSQCFHPVAVRPVATPLTVRHACLQVDYARFHQTVPVNEVSQESAQQQATTTSRSDDDEDDTSTTTDDNNDELCSCRLYLVYWLLFRIVFASLL